LEKPVLGKQSGILTARQIDGLVESGVVRPIRPLEAVQRQPTTLDLRLGDEAIATSAGLLALGGTVQDAMADLAGERLDLTTGAVLRRGQIYLIKLAEELALPEDLRARANPRSSTGRIDVFTRTLVDRHDRFDDVPAGYHGPLWLEVLPRSFDIAVTAGQRLNQLRFLRGRPLLADDDLGQRVIQDDLLGGATTRSLPPRRARSPGLL
jgi:dCTP deaminase